MPGEISTGMQQFACALDPVTAKAIRDSRSPDDESQRHLQHVRQVLRSEKHEQGTGRRRDRYTLVSVIVIFDRSNCRIKTIKIIFE